MQVAVFLTWDYSLKTWSDSKTIDRELKYFKLFAENKNVTIKYFTYGNKEDSKLGDKYNLNYVYPIYRKFYYFNNRYFRLFFSFLIPFFLKRELKNIDLIYQNQLLGCWVPIVIKYIYKIPVIIRTGYDMYDFAEKENKSKTITLFYKYLTKIGLKNCNFFTVSSKTDMERHLSKFPNYKNKILLRTNWVQINDSIDIENRYENKIISVGRLVDQKNYKYLISEFKNTKDRLEIDLVGEGPEKEALLELSIKNNVLVNFLGNISNNELLNLYSKYKYFISTSIFEGNPKTLLEAMGAGCVVFASKIPNHEEIILNKKNGFIFELKENSLLSVFNLISKEKNILKKISSNAIREIKLKNSLEASIDIFHQDFLKAIDETCDK